MNLMQPIDRKNVAKKNYMNFSLAPGLRMNLSHRYPEFRPPATSAPPAMCEKRNY